jgi:hypothetical protein
MIIQFILVIVALGILVFGLRGRSTHFGQASKKIGLLLLFIAMVIAILFPNITNDLAHLVGVGRGADLLLYVLTLAFIAYVLNAYLRQQAERDKLFRLARKVALMDASYRYGVHKDRKTSQPKS